MSKLLAGYGLYAGVVRGDQRMSNDIPSLESHFSSVSLFLLRPPSRTALPVSLDRNQWPVCKYSVCVWVPNKVKARKVYAHMLMECIS